MDAQQQKALQRVQQQRIKGRRLSIGPILPPGGGAHSPPPLSPKDTSPPPFPRPSSQSPLTSPLPSYATTTSTEPQVSKQAAGPPPAPSDSLLFQLAKRASDSHLSTSPTAGTAAKIPAAFSANASAANTAAAGSLYPAVNATDNAAAAGGVVGGVDGRSGRSTPLPPGFGGALAAPAFGAMAVQLQPQQQQLLAYMQAAGHVSSNAVELEVLRARCKELEAENRSLQHRLVDALTQRSSIATERDIFMRLTADARAHWQRFASVSGSPALGLSPANSGQLLLLPESTATLHSQPLPSLQLPQPYASKQGQSNSDPQLEQQLEQLRGEAAAMRQEMAAALPLAARPEGSPTMAAAAAAAA
mmetsp:Transcript_30745/g.80086  ORF Transcript_30745/g.80086 Transcript_30745/m.80086 type:complete len:360 (-) Transcript_30745:763-1842(-)